MPKLDLIGVVEAAYRIDLDDSSWIRGITEAAAPLLDEGLGVSGYLIDVTGGGPPAHTPVVVGARDPWDGDWRRQWWDVRVARMPSRLIADLAGFGSPTYASQSCGAVVRGAVVARLARDIPPLPLPDGVREALVVSGFDPSGAGAVLFAFRERQVFDPPSARDTLRWQRLSGHITAAVRLRRRERRPGSGDDPHRAPGYRATTRAIDRARTRRFRFDEGALDLWPAVSKGGFSIVPSGASGATYAAVENAPMGPELGTLTARERAAVALLSLGRSNKAIAYELGVAPSTVSTFLSSAARKLGVDGAVGLLGRARPVVHAFPNASRLGRRGRLSESETVVLCLLLAGLSDAEIARLRGSTRGTVTKQIDAVFRKLGVGSRRELLARASSLAPSTGADAHGT